MGGKKKRNCFSLSNLVLAPAMLPIPGVSSDGIDLIVRERTFYEKERGRERKSAGDFADDSGASRDGFSFSKEREKRVGEKLSTVAFLFSLFASRGFFPSVAPRQ